MVTYILQHSAMEAGFLVVCVVVGWVGHLAAHGYISYLARHMLVPGLLGNCVYATGAEYSLVMHVSLQQICGFDDPRFSESRSHDALA